MAIYNARYSANVKRPRYFDRQQLAAEDLALGQNYHIDRAKQLNRHLHGWGVVCGAMLASAKDGTVRLSEGFAVSPSGCSIFIPELNKLDLTALLKHACGEEPSDCEGNINDIDKDRSTDDFTREVKREVTQDLTREDKRGDMRDDLPLNMYLIARPIEQATDPRPGIPADCSHQGNSMEYSRICESVCLEIVCELPPLHLPESVPCEDLNALFCAKENADLAKILRQHFSCPDAVRPAEDYVVLATLITRSLPNERRRVVDAVGYDSRRLLLPSQTIQQYLTCLCNRPKPSATPTITSSASATATQTKSGRPTSPFKPRTTQFSTAIPALTRTNLATQLPSDVLTKSRNPLIIEGIDVLTFDPIRGDNTNIDELAELSAADRNLLREMGINNVLEMYTADTSAVADTLKVSEIKVAEYRDKALNNMRRGETITLDNSRFDVEAGMLLASIDLPDVGKTRSKRLAKAGYASFADVANAQADKLADIMKVSDNMASEIIISARNRMRRL